MSTQTESQTRLHGRGLILTRVIWVSLAFLILGIIIAAIPARLQELVYESHTHLLGTTLRKFGVSVDFYIAYNLALEILRIFGFMIVAVIIFGRRSNDWMALFTSLMLVLLAPVWSFPHSLLGALGAARPEWNFALDSLRMIGLGSFAIFLFLFPDGQIIPRWTRILAAWILTWPFIHSLSPSRWESNYLLSSAVHLGLFGTGLLAQIYRYRRFSGPIERQQTKWVVYGFATTVLVSFAVSLPAQLIQSLWDLNTTGLLYQLTMSSVIAFVSLLMPISIGISILRYRLWNIDIFINRSLVYGALTTSVVALYVLIVGWSSIGLQTQNNLAGSVFAIMVIAFLFQPLRQRLQHIADRFVPMPQSTSPLEQTEDKIAIPKGEGAMLRHNRAALFILSIAFLLLTLGAAFVVMRLIMPYDDARLQPGAQGNWHSNGIMISPLNQQTNGLQKGDLVVAVNGRSLESFAQSLFDWSAPRPQWNSAQTLIYTVVRGGRTLGVAVKPTRYPLSAIIAEEWGTIVFAISFLLISGFVFFKRPDESVARVLFLGAAGMASAITWSFGLQVSDIVGAVGWWLYIATTAVGYSTIFITMLHLALVFPQPRPIILRWRWLIPLIYVVPYTILVTTMIVSRVTAASALQWLATAGSAEGLIQLVCATLAIIVHARNYVSLRDPLSRRQLRWVLFAIGVAGITGVVLGVIPELVMGHALLSWNVLSLFGLPIPLALAFAILRYRLFDIDVIINRTLVYGALTAIVIGIYVLVVGYLGVLFRTGNNLAISLIATGLVAVVFQPLRQRLQRGINHLMYGERDDPYAALSRLGRRLKASLAPEAVLPTVVTTVRDVLKLPYAAIYLKQDPDGYKIIAESASPSLRSENGRIRVPGMEREGLCIPLIHQGETLGYIVLGPRAPNEAFNSTDLSLLEDLAPQVGVAVHAVRLTADLQRSRERLVLAREEERRRLRRDLHDGLGPQLAGLTLKLEAARNRLTNDPLADSLLADLAKRTQDATADIRRLVYELRPPTLDELGLVSALREGVSNYSQQGRNNVHITIDTPDNLPVLPAAVEVAVYRITQEALTNVVRHAQAHTCSVHLGLDAQRSFLCLEIKDDGRGLPATRRAGVGLNSMRERAEELGGAWAIESPPTGGTRIVVRLPCRLPDESGPIIREEQ